MITPGGILDRLWPWRWRVSHGPNRGAPVFQALGPHVWDCCPCARRGLSVGGYVDSDAEARDKATRHARLHLLARAVHYEG